MTRDSGPSSIDGNRPLVSVVMANHQGGRYLSRAIESVLAQSLDDLELLAVDDASSDDSVAIMQRAAAHDRRVKFIPLRENGGPARARNAALQQARGHWIAIVDSDDLIHPERFERLITAAAQIGADIVADDLMHFHDDGTPVHFLLGPRYREPFFVSAGDLVRSGKGRSPALGYLKPIFRADLLGDLRYDEATRIGEDQDLLLRILLKGANFWVVPEPWYLYRRHGGSISHRLSPDEVTRMIDGQRRLMATEGARHPEIAPLLRRRLRRLEKALAFERLVADAKRGAVAPALASLLRRPQLVGPLAQSAREHFRKRGANTKTGARDGAPSTVHLGDFAGGMKTSRDEHWLAVPAYLPAGSARWNECMNADIWKQVGDLARGRPLRVHCHGRGAVYAAGFIPADDMELVEVEVEAEPRSASAVWRGDRTLPLDAPGVLAGRAAE